MHVVKHHDAACIEFFRRGAPLYGWLERSGNGTPIEAQLEVSELCLRNSCSERNFKLLKRMRVDKHAETLLEQTREDAALGRMSAPQPLSQIDTSLIAIARRFGVEQGTKPDGTTKVRPVDDETAAGVNPACAAAERLRVHGIDCLMALVKQFILALGCVPALFKADVNAAYRRIPIRPEHRWAAWVAFGCADAIMLSQHFAMMFGAAAAVHAWGRIGSLLTTLARRLLFIHVAATSTTTTQPIDQNA